MLGLISAKKFYKGRYGLDLLSLCSRICEEEDRDGVTEDDVRRRGATLL